MDLVDEFETGFALSLAASSECIAWDLFLDSEACLTISSDPDEDPLSATSGSEELGGNADAVSAPQSSKVFEVLLEVVTEQ